MYLFIQFLNSLSPVSRLRLRLDRILISKTNRPSSFSHRINGKRRVAANKWHTCTREQGREGETARGRE